MRAAGLAEEGEQPAPPQHAIEAGDQRRERVVDSRLAPLGEQLEAHGRLGGVAAGDQGPEVERLAIGKRGVVRQLGRERPERDDRSQPGCRRGLDGRVEGAQDVLAGRLAAAVEDEILRDGHRDGGRPPLGEHARLVRVERGRDLFPDRLGALEGAGDHAAQPHPRAGLVHQPVLRRAQPRQAARARAGGHALAAGGRRPAALHASAFARLVAPPRAGLLATLGPRRLCPLLLAALGAGGLLALGGRLLPARLSARDVAALRPRRLRAPGRRLLVALLLAALVACRLGPLRSGLAVALLLAARVARGSGPLGRRPLVALRGAARLPRRVEALGRALAGALLLAALRASRRGPLGRALLLARGPAAAGPGGRARRGAAGVAALGRARLRERLGAGRLPALGVALLLALGLARLLAAALALLLEPRLAPGGLARGAALRLPLFERAHASPLSAARRIASPMRGNRSATSASTSSSSGALAAGAAAPDRRGGA